MQDYPEDGQGRMSQVQHGSKVLVGLPDDLAPPSVRVDGKVFFVNELLQRSTKGYFIPTKLFQARVGPTPETEVLSLGHRVSPTDVSSETSLFSISPEPVQKGFAVDPKQVIVPVSTFSHTFEELSSRSDVLNPVAFTGSLHIYSIY